MSDYQYATVLEAANDGKPPNGNVESGDITVKAGKHDEDSISYITKDNDMHTLQFDALLEVELPHAMGEREAIEYAADQWRDSEVSADARN
mgnify:CR=1 FL=1